MIESLAGKATSKLLSEPAVEAVRTILDRLTEQLLNG